MQLRAGVLVLYLLCVARTASSGMHPEKITGTIFEAGSLTRENPVVREIPVKRETDMTANRFAGKLRDKRALGLFLSGLAQIFGYTVTPIRIASLPNPTNTTTANAMTKANVMNQRAASDRRPASTSTTAPRRQETIRFTGVLNFGNNSDIIGHLQRYEQIFHGGNATMTTSKPANTSVDPSTTHDSQTKPPLLAPFFVKIPLPIAPNLPPATLPVGDFKVSYPVAPVLSIVGGSNEDTERTTPPIRKQQETVYRNNEDTERYTVEEKDIYDERDVNKPPSKYNHEIVYIDGPSDKQQQDVRYDEVQREQHEHVERPREQEKKRNRDEGDEIDERHIERNREEKIADRNRQYASGPHGAKGEEKRPAYDDEEAENSAEGHEEANASGESDSRQPTTDHERDKAEGYSNHDENENESNEQVDGYKHPHGYAKYVETGYDRVLPIGDYFHESNPEVIRDSYGQVLDDKKLGDDRLSDYFGMFKYQPSHASSYDSREAQNPEDASKNEHERRTSAARGSYDEHLDKLQKLRDEYALPGRKYDEHDVNDDESEAARTSASPRKSKTQRPHRPHGDRASQAPRVDDVTGGSEDANSSREEMDFVGYAPLIVPVRYVDASDKIKQAAAAAAPPARRGNDEEPDGSSLRDDDDDDDDDNDDELEGNVDSTVAEEKLAAPIDSPIGGPRQLHEDDEREKMRIWPPPFDYVFDNTETVAKTVVDPRNPPNGYSANDDRQIARNIAASDNSSEPPSGYVVVVGNPEYPYRYPYNYFYYYPNEIAANAKQDSNLDVEGVYSIQDRVYVPRQSVNQRFKFIQRNPNIIGYNLNGTTKSDYYYQPQETPIGHLDHYRYIFEERTSRDKELLNADRSQITDTAKWPSRMHRSRDKTIESSSPMRNTGFSTRREQNK